MIGIPAKKENLTSYRACIGCGEAIALGHILKAVGENTIIVGATGCAEVFSTPYPKTAWKVPYIHVAFENAAAVASGIEAALKKLNRKVNVVAIAGDGGTFDIGLQALSGAVERGHDFCYICLENGAYMNTGIQRSGATPKYATTTTTPTGNLKWKKPMPLIIAAHQNVYVATANIAYSEDLITKIKKGLEFKGPAYIQIFCPCVPGWGYPFNKTMEIAKLAVESRVNVLYEIEDSIVTINQSPPNPRPVKEYLKTQGRFKHLNENEIKEVQEHINSEFKKLKILEENKIKI
ncbi:MAG: pyruvate synthase subunit beta [Nanoarchaeota archaeon]|nr:pyruvate synthase subunit beta [Nanoarchaeota archaeon]